MIRVVPALIVPEETVLAFLQRNGYSFYAPCGGKGLCGRCRVVVKTSDGEKVVSACHTPITGIQAIFLPEEGILSEEKEDQRYPSDENIVCMDIGTTTLVFSFLRKGKEEHTLSVLNPQRTFGQDVMERIVASKEHLPELSALLYRELNQYIAICRQIFGEDIQKVFACGNTVLSHIFAGISPLSLGTYPYTPSFLETKEFSGQEKGIECEKIILAPSFSAFVGGDIVCGAIACEMEENSLLIDIGTNGEMLYKKGNRYHCTSCSAGPAWEGAGIECGTGAVEGAVCKITEKNGRYLMETIGNKPPSGLCGSGLLDALSILLRHHIIDKKGTLSGIDRYYFGKNIYLSQMDIRKIQLAKSAIRSGAEIMINKFGMPKKVYLSGSFGSHICLQSAFDIGLFPPSLKDKITVCGNTALQGAKRCATQENTFSFAQKIATEGKPFYLSEEPNFQESFLLFTDFSE